MDKVDTNGQIMIFRKYIQKLTDNGELITISEPISKTYEVAAVLKQLESRPVLFVTKVNLLIISGSR